MFETVRPLLCLGVLCLSSYFDCKTREVPNRIWLVAIPVGGVLTLVDLLELNFDPTQTLSSIMSVAVTCGVAYAIFHFGLFGGADAKGLMFISVTTPLPPRVLSIGVGHLLPFFPLSVLDNTLVTSLIAIPYAVLSNLAWSTRKKRRLFAGFESESSAKKLGAFFLCVKVEKSEMKPHHMLAERVEVRDDGTTARRLKLFTRVLEKGEEVQDASKLPDEVFVSLSLPLLVFMTVGYVATLLVGDLIFTLVARLLYPS
jgi:preflagellin peptidase FlaK